MRIDDQAGSEPAQQTGDARPTSAVQIEFGTYETDYDVKWIVPPSEATMEGEYWPSAGNEAALHLVLECGPGGRNNERLVAALARALGRSSDAVGWKMNGLRTNMPGYHTTELKKPLHISEDEVRLLAAFDRDATRVAERCRTSYERLVAGDQPAALSAERQREAQAAKTCPNCYVEVPASGLCGICGESMR